jgi:hypothetical protein
MISKMDMKKKMVKILVLLGTAAALAACLAPVEPQPEPTTVAEAPPIQLETQAFVAAIQTLTAFPTTTPTHTHSPTTTSSPTYTISPSVTPSLTSTITLTPTITLTLEPSLTMTPSLTPTLTNTPTLDPTVEAQQMMDRILGANILVYEDVKAEPDLVPRIDKALIELGLTGEYVINTSDLGGNFEYWLNSGVKWDLIIFSSEARSIEPRLALVEQLIPHMENNGALIIEAWNLNKIISGYGDGSILSLFDRCGIEIQGDLGRPEPPYEPTKYYLFMLAPDNPFLSTPNNIIFPLHPTIYWTGDGGDLIRPRAAADAGLLVGLYPDDVFRSGVVGTCMEGRVVIQTFSTHDYHVLDTTKLYQNYIINTLTNHFKAISD